MDRAEKLRHALGRRADSVLLLSRNEYPDYNFQYYSGLDANMFSGGIFFPLKCEPLLIMRDRAGIRERAALNNILFTKKPLREELPALFRRARRVGINGDYLPSNTLRWLEKKFPRIRFVDVASELWRVRSVKGKEEIACLRKACSITANAVKRLDISVGARELDIAAEIEHYARRKGAVFSPQFPTVVASGKNSTMMHVTTSDRRLREHEMLIVDTGFKYRGYTSDMTRTFCISPTREQKMLYAAVKRAHDAALARAVPGARARSLYLLAKEKLGGYAPYFTYALGHGVGLDIHELPNLYGKSKDVLRAGMVLTVEPGSHPQFGGARIEDTVLIAKKGPEVLTRCGYGLEP